MVSSNISTEVSVPSLVMAVVKSGAVSNAFSTQVSPLNSKTVATLNGCWAIAVLVIAAVVLNNATDDPYLE